MTTVFVPDPVGMPQLLHSWDGAVGKDFSRRLRTLEFRAKMQAGVSTPNPTRIYPGGALRNSIKTEKTPFDASGFVARVGSDRRYAKYHHEGTRPHVIVPRRKGGKLRFWWGRVGRIVYMSRVNHPGTKPNPFLTAWLREAVK